MVPATIETSRVETRVESDADGDETTWYTPRVTYRYMHGGTEYRGERLRFGLSKTSVLKRAHEAIVSYPAGATVSARVNPKNPKEATLETGSPRLGAFLPSAAVFAVLGAILLAVKSAM